MTWFREWIARWRQERAERDERETLIARMDMEPYLVTATFLNGDPPVVERVYGWPSGYRIPGDPSILRARALAERWSQRGVWCGSRLIPPGQIFSIEMTRAADVSQPVGD